MVVSALAISRRQTDVRYRMDKQAQWQAEYVIERLSLTAEHFSPYQLILGTLTVMYAIRHLDDLFGLGGKLHVKQS